MWGLPRHAEGAMELVQCPYDKSHQVSRQRFPWHLDKCKKNYVKNLDNLGFPRRGVMCRYDCGAKEFPQEILRHEEVCIYKPAFAGMEEWFDEEVLEEARNAIKEERAKALGLKVFKKKEETVAEEKKKDQRPTGPRSIADMEWEAGDDEEDWGKQDTGVVFSLYRPLMDP